MAGNGTQGYSGDGGPATKATLGLPQGLAVDAAGNLLIADAITDVVRKVTVAGVISTVAGNGRRGYSGDGGPATSAALGQPNGIAFDSSGDLLIADQNNERVRKVTSGGIIRTVVGNGGFSFAGDGGPGASAVFQYPCCVAVDQSGNLFISDSGSNRVRKMTPTGIISTVAGDGTDGFSGDGGPAIEGALGVPVGVAVDMAGGLYIAENGSYPRIREVTPTGIIGTVTLGLILAAPFGVAVDTAGNLFIAENVDNVIFELTPAGILGLVAGNGTQGYSGDGGPAFSAMINGPRGLAVDSADNLFIADAGNNRIRMVTPTGIISTVAGNGTRGYSGDGGPATAGMLNNPYGVAVDTFGNLFVADTGNNRIRMVTPDGIISTVAGNGTAGYSGDGGPATSAALNQSNGVAVDAAGNLFVADSGNNRIRKVLTISPGVSVTPTQLVFSAASQGAPTTAQSLSLISTVEGLPFSVAVPNDASWLQLTPSSGASPRLIQVTANPTGLAPNTYQTTITIDTPFANPTSSTAAVTFTVTAGQPPSLSIDKQSLSFPFPQHGSARAQTLTVSNSGGGTLKFTTAPSTFAGGPWLSVSPQSGQALPASPVTLTVTANPTGLLPGTYTGGVTVTAGTQSQNIPVTMTISTLDQAILLSQSGISFLAVAQGGVLPAQNFRVLNIGSGAVAWKTSKSTLSGGQDWLQVSPTNGVSDATQAAPTVSVSLNAAGLAQGAYYGQVRVDAPGAANTPQVLTVFLQVLQAGSDVEEIVQPSELVFKASAGGESPGSQEVEVYNVVAEPKSFLSSLAMDSGLTIATLPQAATLNPQQPTAIVVQPFTSGLPPGVHNGTLTLQFSDGNVESVKITVIISSTGTAPSSGNVAQPRSVPAASTAPCTPTKLVPALSTLGQSFAVTAGWPVALGVQVLDDCGNPLNSGSVTVSFSNSDPAIALLSLNDGTWSGTWQTGTSASDQSQVTLTVTATSPDSKLTGTRALAGGLRSQQVPPLLNKNSVVSAASTVSFVPLAPGSMISIFGSGLADAQVLASTTPLPTTLGNASVFMAGQLMPLLYVADGQINAVVPFGVNTNTQQQLLVLRDLTYSLPVQVNLAAAQPAIFTSAGAGIFMDYREGTPGFLVTPSTPAKIGDVLVAYCAGLGATSPMVQDGYPSPSSPPAKTQGVTMRIGGQNAPVSFAGLAPGFVGLYQLNAVVPAGVNSGSTVPVAITVAGQTSPTVVIAIQ